MRPINAFGQTGPAEPAPAPYKYSEYPACRYHTSGAMRLVHSDEQSAALGEGWSATPAEEGPKDEPESGDCDSCVQLAMEKADMESRFNKMWGKRTEDLDALNAMVTTLTQDCDAHLARVAVLEAQNEALLTERAALILEIEKKDKKLAKAA